MSLQLNIRKYEEKDFERLCQVHDPARKSELEYAGLPAAFLPLSIAAEREGLFEYQVYVAEDKGLVVGFIAFSDTELAWLYVDRSCARQGVGSELMRLRWRECRMTRRSKFWTGMNRLWLCMPNLDLPRSGW